MADADEGQTTDGLLRFAGVRCGRFVTHQLQGDGTQRPGLVGSQPIDQAMQV